MNIAKTKAKLKGLSPADLATLNSLVQEEMADRPTYMSNKTHTPNEQARSFSEFLGQAWIHGH